MPDRSLTRLIPGCICLLLAISPPLCAQGQPPDAGSQPYLSMNVGIEVSGLERAAEQAAEGLTLIGESLDKLAENQELTPEQNRQVQLTLARVEDLGDNLSLAIEQLPGTVEKGFEPVVNATQALSDQARQILIIACIALVLIILAALASVYYFVLAPATRSIVETAELLYRLANTLESTAHIVETASQQNREVMNDLRSLQPRTNKPRKNTEAPARTDPGNQPTPTDQRTD